MEGIYKDGKVELSEPPPAITEARVLVTFLVPEDVDLRAIGISEVHAGDLRVRFATLEDWKQRVLVEGQRTLDAIWDDAEDDVYRQLLRGVIDNDRVDGYTLSRDSFVRMCSAFQ